MSKATMSTSDVLRNICATALSGKGLLGAQAAKEYVADLMQNARDAAAWGLFDEAMSLADQCADFAIRRFGAEHSLTKGSVRLLIDLRTR